MNKTPTKGAKSAKPAEGPTGRRRSPVNMIDIRGMTQGLLTVAKSAKSSGIDAVSGGKLWPAKCSGCKTVRSVRYSDFARGRVRTCGQPACVTKLRAQTREASA